jgi:hypothetical protein
MLQTIRDRAQGWIAWAIVILISIPFAFWGIQSYLGVGGEPIAAKVNGVEIPRVSWIAASSRPASNSVNAWVPPMIRRYSSASATALRGAG